LIREIRAGDITEKVSSLFQEACYHLPKDVMAALNRAKGMEDSPVARSVLSMILENAEISARGEIPLCQDTSMAVLFLESGQEVYIVGGDLRTAVNEGVRQGCDRGIWAN